MKRDAGYRLLKGRQGVWGYVRQEGQKDRIALGGLTPGQQYALYAIEEGEGSRVSVLIGDGGGGAAWEETEHRYYFVACEGKIVLWEDGGRPEENYLSACALLSRLEKREEKRDAAPLPCPVAENAGERIEDGERKIAERIKESKKEAGNEKNKQEAAKAAVFRETEENQVQAVTMQQELAPALEQAMQPPSRWTEHTSPACREEKVTVQEEYTLRPSGPGAPVDDLPFRAIRQHEC